MQKQIVHIYFEHLFMFTGQINEWNLHFCFFTSLLQLVNSDLK